MRPAPPPRLSGPGFLTQVGNNGAPPLPLKSSLRAPEGTRTEWEEPHPRACASSLRCPGRTPLPPGSGPSLRGLLLRVPDGLGPPQTLSGVVPPDQGQKGLVATSSRCPAWPGGARACQGVHGRDPRPAPRGLLVPGEKACARLHPGGVCAEHRRAPVSVQPGATHGADGKPGAPPPAPQPGAWRGRLSFISLFQQGPPPLPVSCRIPRTRSELFPPEPPPPPQPTPHGTLTVPGNSDAELGKGAVTGPPRNRSVRLGGTAL